MKLHDIVNHAMREVPRLNPENPALHFLQMLEDAGWEVVKKADAWAPRKIEDGSITPIPTSFSDAIKAETLAKSFGLDPSDLKTGTLNAVATEAKSINPTAERLIAEAKAKRAPKT